MIFSKDRYELERQVTELITRCFASLSEREPMYDLLRTLYYYGSLEVIDIPTSYNMILEKVNTLHSFLFAANTTNFNVEIENSKASNKYLNILKAERAAEAVSDRWHDAKIDLVMDLAVKYSIIYASYFIKLFMRNRKFHPFLVQPWRIGVLDETKTDINRQEAIAHSYACTVHQFARDIVNHPNRAEIASRVQPSNMLNYSSLYPKGIKRIIFAATEAGADYPGGTLNRFPIMTAVDKAYTMVDEIDMHEVWAWDDAEDDWRVFTVANGSVLAWDRFAGDTYKDNGKDVDRRGVLVKGRHPFLHLRPTPMDDYFFGWPDIFNIVRIQEWHTERLADIRQLHKKALNSPKYAEGFQGGLMDERAAAKALNSEGGFYAFKGAQKVGEFKPELPDSIYTELKDIRGLVDDMWGLTNITKGQGDTGVRSRGQAEILSTFGSARLKNKALHVENTCTEAGSLMYELMKRNDGRHYSLEDGSTFVLAQIEDEAQVRVDSHSSSPVFSGELEDKMFALADRQMIDPGTVIDGLSIFFKDTIKRKARQKEKEMLKMQLQAQTDAEKQVIEQERAEEKAKLQTVK